VMRRTLQLLSASFVCASVGCAQPHSDLLSKHLSPQRKEDAQQHWDSMRGDVKLQLARQHLQAGRLDDAEKVLEQTAGITPKNAQVFVLLTRLRLEQGRLADAKQAIQAAQALSAGDPEIPYLAGIVAQRYGNLGEAGSYYAAAARLSPNIASYVLAQAETLVALEQPIDAMELVEGRLKDFDTNGPMHMFAARISRMVGLRGPATAHCREAIRLSPDDTTMIIEAGQILVWAERYGDAISILAPVVEAKTLAAGSPATPSARRCLATAYFGDGRFDQAMKALEPALSDDAVDNATCVLFARAALAAGDVESASRVIQAVHQRGSQSAETLLVAGFIALRENEFAIASEVAGQALRLDPSLAAAYCIRGESAEATGRLDEAKEAYQTALGHDPGAKAAANRLDELSAAHHCEDPIGKTSVVDDGLTPRLGRATR